MIIDLLVVLFFAPAVFGAGVIFADWLIRLWENRKEYFKRARHETKN